ncbi:MAG: hypothetical protein U0235_35305 [Polyangiaceae bacterium]
MVAAVADDGAVKLTWAAIEGATSYEVARATSSGAEVMLTTVSAAELVDTGVEAETTYFYKVTPKSAAASGAASAEVSATPFLFDKLHMRYNAQVLRGVAEGAGNWWRSVTACASCDRPTAARRGTTRAFPATAA